MGASSSKPNRNVHGVVPSITIQSSIGIKSALKNSLNNVGFTEGDSSTNNDNSSNFENNNSSSTNPNSVTSNQLLDKLEVWLLVLPIILIT